MKPSRRLTILLAMLTLLGGLVVFDKPGGGTSPPRIVEARPARGVAPETAHPVTNDPAGQETSPLLALLDRRGAGAAIAGFETRDWTPPPPPPPPQSRLRPSEQALPSSPPQAPPLPFVYIGKQWDGGRWTVFLAHQENTYIATEGVTIESIYRVEKIAPPNLTVIYLPLQQPQTFAIGSAE